MLSVEDYKAALDIVSNLIADYIHSSNVYYLAPNTEQGKEWRQKSLYITMMYDILSSLNGIRQITRPINTAKPTTYKPRIYNPDDG